MQELLQPVAIMERKGTVIRFVDHLDISDTAKHWATELVDQIEMPVVFLIDHDLDKQYATRSQMHHNQFWVLACHQAEHSEYERIILSNIYRGVQTRKRFLHPVPNQEYEAYLNQIVNPKVKLERRKLYYQLLNKIFAFVSTIDAEIFFKPKGIEVSSAQKQWLYDNRISLLDEYLVLQKRQRGFCWYREVECINIIDYARIASFNNSYKVGIVNRLKRIHPVSASKRCIERVSKLSSLIGEASQKYGSFQQEEITAWMVQEVVRTLGLENDLDLKREYALNGDFVLETGEHANMHSYVPIGFPDESVVIQALRSINECILLLQEFYATFLNKTLPDTHANLIQSNHVNAYANKLPSGYYLSFTDGLLIEVMRSSQDCINKVPPQHIATISESTVRSRLTKYALFYITAHEYAHILHGDCEQARFYQPTWNLVDNKEEHADSFARETLSKLLLMQYRPDMQTDLLSRIREFSINRTVDPILLNAACDWCDLYFSRLKNR